ncbi:hypothetical protein Vadar_024692 [Vaccinium darrowii]|uniref:Uncharacterized protein n=1 Tax=Vaccinium darrowii TaxID=229202 RepID=A0ACB7Z6Y4_9ERIC|nr:hypothetical protein Vadar_024692 [Vaccinium darrowii]
MSNLHEPENRFAVFNVMARPWLRGRGRGRCRGGARAGGRFRAEPEVEESGIEVEIENEPLSEAEVKYRRMQRMQLTLSLEMDRRWHPETNSFHFDLREMGPTLDDVEQLLGIPTYGLVVCTKDERDAKTLLMDLLGVSENEAKNALAEAKGGQAVTFDWLREQGKCFPLALLENLDRVSHYGWGASMLAFVYRQLGQASRRDMKQLSGFLILLEIIFNPYKNRRQVVPPNAFYTGPIRAMHIVEPHLPD